MLEILAQSYAARFGLTYGLLYGVVWFGGGFAIKDADRSNRCSEFFYLLFFVQLLLGSAIGLTSWPIVGFVTIFFGLGSFGPVGAVVVICAVCVLINEACEGAFTVYRAFATR